MMNIIVCDTAPFGIVSYISAKKWQIESVDEVIEKLKGLHLEPQKLQEKSFVDTIGDVLKEFSGTEFTQEIEYPQQGEMNQEQYDKLRNDAWKDWSDVIFCGGTGSPFVNIEYKDHADFIFLAKVDGNCVDKFVAYKINAFFANFQKCMRVIGENTQKRKEAENYLESDIYENDFASLSLLKNATQKLLDNITKFQEDITLGYK